MRRAIKIAGLFALILGLPAFARAQIIEQQSCPSGTVSLIAPGTVTVNNANGQVLRQWCIDNNGNLYSTGHYHSGTEKFNSLNIGNDGNPGVISPVTGVKDNLGNTLPLGADTLFESLGAGDLHLRTANNASPNASTTATTSLTGGGGAQNVTVVSTANFYSLGGCVVEPYAANEEILTPANCSIVDSTTLSITPAKNHTQPYNISQLGSIRLDSWNVQTYDTNNTSPLFQLRAIGTGTGGNRGFQWGHSSQGLKYFATGKFGQAQDFIPRFYGKSGGSTASLIFYESSAGTGGVGGFSWRNNDADDTEFLKLDNLGQLFTTGGIFPASDTGSQLGTAGLRFANLFTSISTANFYNTASNCSSSASPAVCGSAAAGSVTIAAGATTETVNTTAVTANSQIFVMEDDSLGTKLGVTCNTSILASPPEVTARVAATSFTITTSASPVTNPACYSYFIVN